MALGAPRARWAGSAFGGPPAAGARGCGGSGRARQMGPATGAMRGAAAHPELGGGANEQLLPPAHHPDSARHPYRQTQKVSRTARVSSTARRHVRLRSRLTAPCPIPSQTRPVATTVHAVHARLSHRSASSTRTPLALEVAAAAPAPGRSSGSLGWPVQIDLESPGAERKVGRGRGRRPGRLKNDHQETTS